MKNIFHEIKRIISQYFETEYWYRFKKHKDLWFDEEKGKYIELKPWHSRDVLTSTWDGEGDILLMMLLKIEHQFYNLKKYGTHLDFYFNTYKVLEVGTEEDKVRVFNWIVKEYQPPIGNKKKLSDWKININNFDKKDCYETRFAYDHNEDNKPIYFIIRTYKDDNSTICLYGEKEEKILLSEIDYSTEFGKKIIDGVLKSVYDVSIPLTEYKDISDNLKKYACGNRRTLTDLLHLRHMINKLYNLNDTDDKYYSMWKDLPAGKECSAKIKEAHELYKKDRKELYMKIAEFMAEKGNGWWD